MGMVKNTQLSESKELPVTQSWFLSIQFIFALFFFPLGILPTKALSCSYLLSLFLKIISRADLDPKALLEIRMLQEGLDFVICQLSLPFFLPFLKPSMLNE